MRADETRLVADLLDSSIPRERQYKVLVIGEYVAFLVPSLVGSHKFTCN